MDRFKEMQVFVRIAERRSFAAAAEDLLIPRPTVTNLIKRLEGRLQARLVERTTRQVNLTQDGEAYYRRCVYLLNELEDMDSAFANAQASGQLKVSLQGTLARHFVMPKLNQFLSAQPKITLQIAEGDRLVDLVGEGFDCVLRAGELQDSTLIARRLASLRQITVASPGYLKHYGVPADLADLETHWAVGYSLDSRLKPTTLDFSDGEHFVEKNLRARIFVAGADLYTLAAVAGQGLIQVPEYRISQELAQGTLVPVLEQCPPPPMPVSVLYPQNRHLSPRVRVFVHWLAECFTGSGKPGVSGR